MDVDVSEEKFRVLLSELKAVKALMDEGAGRVWAVRARRMNVN